MNSERSMRTSALSLPKSASASALASSVLPTPLGPLKRKLPSGLRGSCEPARARRMASETAAIARSCPIDAFGEHALELEQADSACDSVSAALRDAGPTRDDGRDVVARHASDDSTAPLFASATDAAASSIRSMALSGRKRSAM